VTPAGREFEEELSLLDDPLSADSLGRVAVIGPANIHNGHRCEGSSTSIEVGVADIDNPIRLSVVVDDDRMEARINQTLMESSSRVTAIDTFGLFSQTYERPRSHIHFDEITITTKWAEDRSPFGGANTALG